MDVSIIYVNYKTNKILLDSILSVMKNINNCSYEIIVVDNSDDLDIYCELKSEMLKISDVSKIAIKTIDPKNNLGFGRANNVGAQYASGKYLLFLNTDTLIYNDAVSILKDYLDRNPRVGIVGPNILDRDLNPFHSFYKNEKNLANYYKNNGLISSLAHKLTNKRNDYNYSQIPLEIQGYVCGACMMIRKQVFERVGGFDKDIFMYAEETLLSYKVIHETNMKIYNVPYAKIIHLEGASFNEKSLNRIKMMVDGNWVYLKKAFGVDNAITYAKKEIVTNYYKGIILQIFRKQKENYFTLISRMWRQKLKELKI